MCPGSTVRAQEPGPVPHRSQQEGQGTLLSGHCAPLQKEPAEAQARPHHRGTGHVIYVEPCVALEREVGQISGTATSGQWDVAVPGGVPVLTWSQALQVTTTTVVTAKLE